MKERQSFGIQFVCRKNKEREKNFTIFARITINGAAATVTLSNGVPIETVSKMLGHTSIKTTQIRRLISILTENTIPIIFDTFAVNETSKITY